MKSRHPRLAELPSPAESPVRLDAQVPAIRARSNVVELPFE
jgi:hypothetical protein